jgi:type II secretory pathway pseudopilin PulG
MKRRKKQAGVALTEALIAVSMMIVMFGGVVYFYNAYTAKAKVLREARLQAWLATDQSCQGGGQGQAVQMARVPPPFAQGAIAELPVASRHEMKCNEKHDPRTTVSGVLAWSGLGEQLGNFGSMILEVFSF